MLPLDEGDEVFLLSSECRKASVKDEGRESRLRETAGQIRTSLVPREKVVLWPAPDA